ncbi:GGDEF domain-containing protein [Halomonas vilamensis]|uniref:diguanylate cyclase n=1 Tax=Vreelandella vilamensis TaxID=531309 RepID=A0ABU1H4Q9_9GAMM|nr:GGDEF domain-containing protein [Halomonas vilamensis]MDR5899214.1 GGDEF domain-containing protein [Halomonas vilamensis]
MAIKKRRTDRKRLENRLDFLAHHDEMTGLLNRRAGLKCLTAKWEGYNCYGNALCIAILDIDHFKQFNDTYGHHIGDEVLIELSRFLLEEVRTSDSRLGGEEFMLNLPGADNKGPLER